MVNNKTEAEGLSYMRIPLTCMKCFREKNSPANEVYPAELMENGVYKMTCKYGHTTYTTLQEMKFEILYDLAANAIIDGYYREAILSFTSSLERFYEFYIETISIKNNVMENNYLETWKVISSQSERQLGAYIFTYLNETGLAPPLLHNKFIKLRNEVAHKGKYQPRKRPCCTAKLLWT